LSVARTAVPAPGRRILRPRVVLATGLVAAALTACSSEPAPSSSGAASSSAAATTAAAPTGGSSVSAESQAPSTVLQATEVDFAIELPEKELPAGTYTIEVTNKGTASHDLVVEDAAGTEVAASELIGPGRSGSVEVTLEPGEYVFYCSVGNHRDMGMEVPVTVV
jgi:uncharacterized cupredoxin-like copper-binding protein